MYAEMAPIFMLRGRPWRTWGTAVNAYADNNCPRRRISWPVVASAPARYRLPIIGRGGIFDTVIGTTREDARIPRRAFGHIIFPGKKERL